MYAFVFVVCFVLFRFVWFVLFCVVVGVFCFCVGMLCSALFCGVWCGAFVLFCCVSFRSIAFPFASVSVAVSVSVSNLLSFLFVSLCACCVFTFLFRSV